MPRLWWVAYALVGLVVGWRVALWLYQAQRPYSRRSERVGDAFGALLVGVVAAAILPVSFGILVVYWLCTRFADYVDAREGGA